MKNTIRRVRHQEQVPLPTSTSLQDLTISGEFLLLMRGEAFFLYNSGPVQHRTLVFSTHRNLDLMARCPNWYADETFKTAPPLFQQLYIIHAVQYNSVLPIVFILMTERCTNAYIRVLTELNSL